MTASTREELSLSDKNTISHETANSEVDFPLVILTRPSISVFKQRKIKIETKGYNSVLPIGRSIISENKYERAVDERIAERALKYTLKLKLEDSSVD